MDFTALPEKYSTYKTAKIVVLPIPYDGTATLLKGSDLGPQAILAASSRLSLFDLETNSEVYRQGICTLPPLSRQENPGQMIDEVRQQAAPLFRDGKLVVGLGGKHVVSIGLIQAALERHSDLSVIHFDAHADLREEYQGYHYSHASIIRRCLDHFGPGHQLLQFGIRSGAREEYVWMRENKTLAPSLDDFVAFIEALPASRPIYLTLDLDYFDPAFLPGTGTPEPGGQDFFSFVRIVQALHRKNMVAADVVELSPPVDVSGNSDVFATKVVRELILAFHREGKNEE